MLAASDFKGLYAIVPTPAKPGSDRVETTDTIDLDETARLISKLIEDGVSGLICLGTTGECATLSSSDYRSFAGCVLDVANRRVPTLVGTSALGGHEVASRMRFIRDNGADGTLLGLPMWQPVTTDMAVDFFSQISSAFPDVAIMVYANARAFRYKFPPEFWDAVMRSAPTVTSAKFSRPQNLRDLIARTDNRIHFMPNEMTIGNFYDVAPETTTACWATAAGMGPAPVIRLMHAYAGRDKAVIDTLIREIAEANAPLKFIFNDPEIFASYNIQLEKTRINAAGYCHSGPCRPPYNHFPKNYSDAAEECGRRWALLQKKYCKPAESADERRKKRQAV